MRFPSDEVFRETFFSVFDIPILEILIFIVHVMQNEIQTENLRKFFKVRETSELTTGRIQSSFFECVASRSHKVKNSLSHRGAKLQFYVMSTGESLEKIGAKILRAKSVNSHLRYLTIQQKCSRIVFDKSFSCCIGHSSLASLPFERCVIIFYPQTTVGKSLFPR